MQPDAKAEAVAREMYADISAGEVSKASALMTADQQTPSTAGTLQRLRAWAPPAAPASVERIGWRKFVGTGGTTAAFAHRYRYPDRQIVAQTVLLSTPQGWRVRGFHLNMEATPNGPPLPIPPPPPTAQPRPSHRI